MKKKTMGLTLAALTVVLTLTYPPVVPFVTSLHKAIEHSADCLGMCKEDIQ